jgi:predicted ArsR family transcriptional regulator
VVHQPEPVTLDEAAAARVLPRTTAAFHLDRLVEKDLLDTPVPGGTPCQALPALALARGRITAQCRYDLARSLLSGPFEHAERFGGSPRAILGTRAYQLGNQLGETARSTVGDHDTHDTALRILEECGFELRIDGDDGSPIAPFHALAQEDTEIVCGMNLRLLEGLQDHPSPREYIDDHDR